MFLFDPVIGSVDCMYAMHVSVWEYLFEYANEHCFA